MNYTRKPSHEKAILVGVLTPQETRWEVEDGLDELSLLAGTAGADVTDRVTQSLPSINAATYIGKGKVAELKRLVADRESDLVIFDHDLSAIQMRNLEREIGCKLVDRSGLILDIFARNAKTAIAKTQVELAQLDYTLTRLTRQWTHLSRQKGGIGTKGPGETQIETDRRLIGTRMALLKERLEKIDRQRSTQRKGRERLTRISLVGYTNAGKSTLMNSLSDAKVLAENKLFATLDTTTRSITLKTGQEVLLSDTVGFIRKLPHKLIESFKSTLDEVRESDILLHVIDVHHPCYDEQIRTVNATLAEIGVHDVNTIMVFNKVDLLEERGLLPALKQQYPDAVFVSGLRGIGIDAIIKAIMDVVEKDHVEKNAVIPVRESKTIAYIHENARVVSEKYVVAHDVYSRETDQIPAVQMRFKINNRFVADLDRVLAKYDRLEVVSQMRDGSRRTPSEQIGVQ